MRWGVADLFAVPDIEVERRADGSTVLRSRDPLGEGPPSLGAMLAANAASHAERTFLAERAGGGWRTLTHGEAWASAQAIGQSLVDRGAGSVAVLSGNSVDHALLMLGCFLAGVPFTPVSPAYSLLSSDLGKLRHVLGKVRADLVFASGEPFARALEVTAATGATTITTLDGLLDAEPGPDLQQAMAAVGPDTVAKYLFTSGSTGVPKGVPNTHRMLCGNQQAMLQTWPFLAARPPVLVDWLPWSHTFGGNHNFNLVLARGGTMYIDGGKPLPALVGTTVDNLREVSPTIYFNVPAGYATLLPYLESDAELAKSFFARLELIFYAAAALPLDTWRRIDAVARATTGREVAMTSAWGSTETSPLATSAHFALDGPGNLGVPVPGVEVKLVPAEAKTELRVRGSNVFAGYLDEPELTAAAFDEEGFYRIGDAGRFVNEADPAAGIAFDGRIAEDFKLSTGTWVSVTNVRTALISATAPMVTDAVIAGHGRDDVCALVWLAAGAEPGEHLAAAIAAHNAEVVGSAACVRRVVVLRHPPSIDAGEVTDKGYINQGAVLRSRAHLVDLLYTQPYTADVLVVD